ncbi:MAG: DNA alkylation repair protein [Desulfobacterales bacterium]|nr:DNA alkylation repair protein [Desulfobacterales bacterium]
MSDGAEISPGSPRKGDISAHLAAFRQALSAPHDPERAANEKRYLKSPHKFFGVTVPFTDRLARDFRKTHRDAPREEIFALAEALWSSEYHQEKTLAVKLLEKYPHHLDIRSMPVIERNAFGMRRVGPRRRHRHPSRRRSAAER